MYKNELKESLGLNIRLRYKPLLTTSQATLVTNWLQSRKSIHKILKNLKILKVRLHILQNFKFMIKRWGITYHFTRKKKREASAPWKIFSTRVNRSFTAQSSIASSGVSYFSFREGTGRITLFKLVNTSEMYFQRNHVIYLKILRDIFKAWRH